MPRPTMAGANSAPSVAVLRELREAMGLTREQFAATVGLKYETLVNIERGKNAPSLTTAEKIYRFFDRPIGSIVWASVRPTRRER